MSRNRIFLFARVVDDLKSWILMILSRSCVVVGRKPRKWSNTWLSGHGFEAVMVVTGLEGERSNWLWGHNRVGARDSTGSGQKSEAAREIPAGSFEQCRQALC